MPTVILKRSATRFKDNECIMLSPWACTRQAKGWVDKVPSTIATDLESAKALELKKA